MLLDEGQSVCLSIWLSWCEGSFAAATEWLGLTSKWLLMDNWTQLTSRLGPTRSIQSRYKSNSFVAFVDLPQGFCPCFYNRDGIHKFSLTRVKPVTKDHYGRRDGESVCLVLQASLDNKLTLTTAVVLKLKQIVLTPRRVLSQFRSWLA